MRSSEQQNSIEVELDLKLCRAHRRRPFTCVSRLCDFGQTWQQASHNGISRQIDCWNLILAGDVESNLRVLGEARATAEGAALENMNQYVANRAKPFEAFNRIDPDSQATRDARERLERARQDHESYARSIGVAVENPGATAAESDEGDDPASLDPGQSTTEAGSD